MDEIEIAEQGEELYLASALLDVRRVVYSFPDDECLNCEAQLGRHRQRFCDPDCAADWAARQDIKGRTWNV